MGKFLKGWRRKTAVAIVVLSIIMMIVWDQATVFFRNGDIFHISTVIQAPVRVIIVRKGWIPAWIALCNSGPDEKWRLTIPLALLLPVIGFPAAYSILVLPIKKGDDSS